MICDVLVVGGGPAGSMAAMNLARNGVSVGVLDRTKESSLRIGESLPSSAAPLLRKLEILDLVENGRHVRSFGNVSAWGSQELLEVDFIRDPNGLGWHLDRGVFDRDLREKVLAANVPWVSSFVKSVVKAPGSWVVETYAGSIETGFLIDATGRNAVIARQQGAKRLNDDKLTAFFGWIETGDSDPDTRTFVESTPNGWWYSSKVPHGNRVLAFHTDCDRAGEFSWLEELESCVHVKAFSKSLSDGAKPLRQAACGSVLDRWAGPGWLACGDAAMTFDPLSSQGIFNALYSGDLAGRAITELFRGNADALVNYHDRLALIRESYLGRHRFYYGMESRWPKSEFWRRRHPTP